MTNGSDVVGASRGATVGSELDNLENWALDWPLIASAPCRGSETAAVWSAAASIRACHSSCRHHVTQISTDTTCGVQTTRPAVSSPCPVGRAKRERAYWSRSFISCESYAPLYHCPSRMARYGTAQKHLSHWTRSCSCRTCSRSNAFAFGCVRVLVPTLTSPWKTSDHGIMPSKNIFLNSSGLVCTVRKDGKLVAVAMEVRVGEDRRKAREEWTERGPEIFSLRPLLFVQSCIEVVCAMRSGLYSPPEVWSAFSAARSRRAALGCSPCTQAPTRLPAVFPSNSPPRLQHTASPCYRDQSGRVAIDSQTRQAAETPAGCTPRRQPTARPTWACSPFATRATFCGDKTPPCLARPWWRLWTAPWQSPRCPVHVPP